MQGDSATREWTGYMEDRITVYGSFTSSSSYKAMLFMALARLPYTFKTVNLKTGAQHAPDYLAINRFAQVPALRHRGLTIVQSNVILDYLARATGMFEGATETDRWRAREWLSWEADGLTNVARVRHFSRFRTVDAAVMAQFRTLAEAALTFFDSSLKGRSWLVGDTCTLADIGCWGRMVFMAEGGIDIGRWPNIAAWSHGLASLPGFALPYDLIPKRDQEMGPTSAAGDDKLAAGHRPRDGHGGSGTGGETS
jgi:glutathione S-transferase